jgi:hypothetical protein
MKFFLDTCSPVHPKPLYNTVAKWSGTDTLVNFNNYQPNPYTLDSILYEYNEAGFRSDSFNLPADKRIVFLGCSMTEGTGLPKHHTWAYRLLELIKAETGLQIPYWNLGMGGTGVDAITRIFYHWGEVLKPNLVFGLWPSYRKEYKSIYGHWVTTLPSLRPNIFESNPFLVEDATIQYETEKNFAIINLMLQRNNSTLIWDFWDIQDKFMPTMEAKFKTFENRVDLYNKISKQLPIEPGYYRPVCARDGKHPGEEYNKRFAQQLFEEKKDIILKALS